MRVTKDVAVTTVPGPDSVPVLLAADRADFTGGCSVPIVPGSPAADSQASQEECQRFLC